MWIQRILRVVFGMFLLAGLLGGNPAAGTAQTIPPAQPAAAQSVDENASWLLGLDLPAGESEAALQQALGVLLPELERAVSAGRLRDFGMRPEWNAIELRGATSDLRAELLALLPVAGLRPLPPEAVERARRANSDDPGARDQIGRAHV